MPKDLNTDPVICLPTTPAAPAADMAQAAFERTRKRRAELSPLELTQIKYEVGAAAMLVRGALPAVRPYRDRIIALGEMSAERFDALEDNALAAWHANGRWVGSSRPTQPIADLIARADGKRDMLMNAAVAAADKGLIPRDRLRELSGGRSGREVAQNLGALRGMLVEAWPTLAGRTALEVADLDEAGKIYEELLNALTSRESTQVAVSEANDDRVRAASVLEIDWAEVRRALQFIRHHEGDAETIAPSLYQRSAPKRDDGEGEGEEEREGAPAGNGRPVTVTRDAQPGNGGANGGAGPAKPAGDGATRGQPGMPDSHPFDDGDDDER